MVLKRSCLNKKMIKKMYASEDDDFFQRKHKQANKQTNKMEKEIADE